MNVDVEAIEDARDRDGMAASVRPEYVDEALEDKERVGYQYELPLVGDSYEEYITGDGLYRPEAAEFLRELFDHPLVTGFEDAADECNSTAKHVEKAAQLHGLDLPTGDAVEEDGDTVDLLTTTLPKDSDVAPLAVQHLYLEGMGTGEIASYLSEEGITMTSGRAMELLSDVGLIESTPSRGRGNTVTNSDLVTQEPSKGIEN